MTSTLRGQDGVVVQSTHVMAVGTSFGCAGHVKGMSAEDLLLYSGALPIGCMASCGPYWSGEPGDGGWALAPNASCGFRLELVDGVLPCAEQRR
jgi:hypothetical protein